MTPSWLAFWLLIASMAAAPDQTVNGTNVGSMSVAVTIAHASYDLPVTMRFSDETKTLDISIDLTPVVSRLAPIAGRILDLPHDDCGVSADVDSATARARTPPIRVELALSGELRACAFGESTRIASGSTYVAMMLTPIVQPPTSVKLIVSDASVSGDLGELLRSDLNRLLRREVEKRNISLDLLDKLPPALAFLTGQLAIASVDFSGNPLRLNIHLRQAGR